MRDLICGLAENATVILSTHIMQEVDAICDRALILRDGKLVLDFNKSYSPPCAFNDFSTCPVASMA